GHAERCDGVDFDCDGVLFPETSPCFLTDGDGQATRCVIGTRACNDQPGSANAGFSACMRDVNAPATTLPMEWCTAACTTPTDPIQCQSSASPDCVVSFPTETSTTPCPPEPAEIPLPEDEGVGGC